MSAVLPLPARRSDFVAGGIYALLAYASWGLMPAFWKQIHGVDAAELVAHRVVWSLLVTLALVAWFRRGAEFLATLRSPRRLAVLAVSTLLVTGNWLLFVWAVQRGQVLEASLGYFINPLLNVVLGMLLLKERLRPLQWLAVLIAAAGVVNQGLQLHTLPWVALTLALTFGCYGLIRKLAPVEPLVGLTVETLLATPLALGYLLWLAAGDACAFLLTDGGQRAWIMSAGLITALPLLWFANAAKRLKLSTLGFFQYLAPSGQMLLAVFAYGEPFTPVHMITFGCIWAALLIYSADARRGMRID
ncbi:EamA family transporter RarD [Plasticicumulans acidivorans]|uniref:Chloramphenicol-sensitive protein RarD n=1 Tax=Plasticicumulans acidivorans TaxID=886464 RepID=A0A317MY88_9GAMM|nr:EamA family transporter RarD [Plasticicumulans acidivorans]PWV64630.1 chloramphenicol-sensitive protein RarD [Plasticicumulans acidivorans]